MDVVVIKHTIYNIYISYLQVPNVDVVVVPVGGAGLIAGIALAIKTVRPDVVVSSADGQTRS